MKNGIQNNRDYVILKGKNGETPKLFKIMYSGSHNEASLEFAKYIQNELRKGSGGMFDDSYTEQANGSFTHEYEQGLTAQDINHGMTRFDYDVNQFFLSE